MRAAAKYSPFEQGKYRLSVANCYFAHDQSYAMHNLVESHFRNAFGGSERSDPRNTLRLKTQTPNDFFGCLAKVDQRETSNGQAATGV